MPNPFESQRVTVVGKRAEAAYGVPTPTADPTAFRMIPVKDNNFTDWKPMKTDNQMDAQGNDFATEQYLEAWDAERDMEVPVTAEDIGDTLYAAFGAVTTDQPDAGANAPVFRHVFTLQDGNTSRQLFGRSLVEILASTVGGINAYNCLFPSMIVKSFGMKNDGSTGRIFASVKLKGNGRKVIGSGMTIAQALAQLPSGRHYFFSSQANVITKDNNNTTNSLNYGTGLRLNSWSMEFDNDLLEADGYRPGSGAFNTASTSPVAQVETTTIVGTATGTGTLIWTVTAAGMSNSPKAVTVNILSGDTPTVQAGKVVTALNADVDVSSFFVASNLAGAVKITAKIPAANDATMNLALALGTATGVTAVPTSTHTTAGVAGVYDPTSGLVRAELLFGRRKLTIPDFTVRLFDQTKELADLLSGRAIDFQISLTGGIIPGGTGAYSHQLTIQFPLVKYSTAQVSPQGISSLKITPEPLYDTVQGFAIKATLINTVSSYTS